MKHTERGEQKQLSRVQQGYSFTGLIYPKWCLTPLKAHILPLHLKPQLDFPLKKTSQNKSGASPRVCMQKKKAQDEVEKEQEEEDVGLSPSHACVSVLVCWGRVSPFHPPNQPPSSSTQPCLDNAEPRRLT